MNFERLGKAPFAALLGTMLLAMVVAQWLFESRGLAPVVQTQAQLHTRMAQARQMGAAQNAQATAPQLRLTDILQRLPQQPERDARVALLHQLAKQRGVSLRKVSYQWQTPAQEVAQLEAVADLSGSYPALRQFLRDLLQQDPAVAIASLEFSRPAGSAGVRTQARLVFYFKP